MSKVILVCRLLLGLVFFVFGLNGVLHFFGGPTPTGDAGQFATIMAQHGYMTFVAICQIVGGLLLLVGRYVPLGLTILAPIIVNILLFHILLEVPFSLGSMVPGILLAVLEVFLIFAYRLSFRGLFDANPETF